MGGKPIRGLKFMQQRFRHRITKRVGLNLRLEEGFVTSKSVRIPVIIDTARPVVREQDIQRTRNLIGEEKSRGMKRVI